MINNNPWMKDGGPAFPASDGGDCYYKGMSLRDWFAGRALRVVSGKSYEELATNAYKLADAMLAAREAKS